MTTLQFSNYLAQELNLTKKEAKKTIYAVLNGIQKQLENGGVINFVGFGKFSTVKRKERNGFNPRTRESITIEAQSTPRFKAGSKLKAAVN